MKTKILIPLFLIILAGVSSAYQIALFPMRQGYEGWDITGFVTLENNMSRNVTFKLHAVNPVNHTKYNESGIYDTITDGNDLKEFKNFPDLSWIKLPDEVTVGAFSNKTIYFNVSIPKNERYAGKHYEALISCELVSNSTIKTSLASRLLVTTPEMEVTPDVSVWVVVVVIVAVVLAMCYKKI